jgi:glycine cleavage system H protein
MLIRGSEFPDGLWYHAEDQVWARLGDDGTACVGITAMGIRMAGEIYMCRPKSAGSVVQQGRSVAVVELAKSIVSVRSPVTGEVLETNPQLADRPEVVHLDPYGDGWLARVRLSCWELDRAGLVQGDAVGPAMERVAWLNQLESP